MTRETIVEFVRIIFGVLAVSSVVSRKELADVKAAQMLGNKWRCEKGDTG